MTDADNPSKLPAQSETWQVGWWSPTPPRWRVWQGDKVIASCSTEADAQRIARLPAWERSNLMWFNEAKKAYGEMTALKADLARVTAERDRLRDVIINTSNLLYASIDAEADKGG